MTIIKHFHIVDDGGFDGCSGLLLGRVVEPFVFHTAEHALHDRIVPTIAPPTHAADHLMPLEQRLIGLTRILTPAIRVMQESRRRVPSPNGHGQGGRHQRSLHGGRHGPAHNLPRKQIHHHREIEPPILCGQIGDVTAPHPIRRLDRKLPI